jgi:hypothetical protein
MLHLQHRDNRPTTAHMRPKWGLGMGKAMVRQRFLSTLVVAIACLNAALAHALPESAAVLESQAQAEFARVGIAVRERLDREAAGDVIGARIAAKDAEAHRYRFLDIKRAMSRLRSPSLASPSVAASRNPFLPDAFLVSSASPTRGAPLTIGRPEAVVRDGYPAWDMYRPHELPDRAGTERPQSHPESQATSAEAAVRGAGDMYSNGVARLTAGDRAAVPTDLSAGASPGEPPREPFLVYRERLAGSDSRQ